MLVKLADAQWLRGNGYRHLSFLSWATSSGDQIRETALACKNELERILAKSELPNQVFFDKATLPPGAQWEPALAEAVCRSLCLIPFCCNSYYASVCCGREFSTMDRHGETRLGKHHRLIIPVYCWGEAVPPIISRFQALDISRNLFSPDRNFRSKKWFRDLVEALAKAVDESAQCLASARQVAVCDTPELTGSALEPVPPQTRLPFRRP